MQVPSVCSDNGFERLGMEPVSLETVVPGYLAGSARDQLYTRLRSSAGRS